MEEIITTRAQLQTVNQRLGEWVAGGSIQSSRTFFSYPETPKSSSRQDHKPPGWCDTCEAPESYASPVDRSDDFPSSDGPCHMSDSSPPLADRVLGSFGSSESRNIAEAAGSVIRRNAVSPDSSIPCDDPTCPIGIPHNKGRFYYHGKKADEPTDEELTASQAPPAHFFNFTVPTPEIARAYRRMMERRASAEDRHSVQCYVRTHIYSPVISAPATPKIQATGAQLVRMPCLIFDPKGKSVEERARQFEMIEKDLQDYELLMESRDEASLSNQEGMRRVSDAAPDIRPPLPPIRRRKRAQTRSIAAYNGRMERQRTGQTGDHGEVRRDQERAHRKMLPGGICVDDAQVSIQENIINEIAQRAIKETSERGSEASDISSSRSSGASKGKAKVEANKRGSDRDSSASAGTNATWVTTEDPEEIDRELEVHAALTKKLRQDLLDGSVENIYVRNRQGERQTQRQYMTDILLLVRRSLKRLLGDFDREYRPTSFEVTDEELGELAGKLMESYEMLLATYPARKIKDIISNLDEIGKCSRIENVL